MVTPLHEADTQVNGLLTAEGQIKEERDLILVTRERFSRNETSSRKYSPGELLRLKIDNASIKSEFLVDIISSRSSFHIDLVRVAVRFFRGVPHPHLLGVCYPNLFLIPR